MTLWDRFFNRAYDKDTIDKVKFLSNIYIFKGIRRKDLLYLLENLYEKKYLKGETIFLKGDVGKALFIIYRGKIGLYNTNDMKSLVAEVNDGEFVGEMALLEEMPRTMCAVALQDSDVFMLYKINLENMIKTKPKIASMISYNLACVLSARLRSLIEND
ncbi:MAG: cyclic nucleotide-binding domain-containing protein [Elusimicrobiales bacterium]|nr:cyclic nucleotide-binding domain-containing protein [Elusimicrobiales bacterium]